FSSPVRTPNRSISSTTRSLCTTCPRIAPRPPPAANRFTLRSAIRTPEQKPYFSARLTFIVALNAFDARKILAVGGWRLASGADRQTPNASRYNPHPHGRKRTALHPSLRRTLGLCLRHLFLRVSASPGHPI